MLLCRGGGRGRWVSRGESKVRNEREREVREEGKESRKRG